MLNNIMSELNNDATSLETFPDLTCSSKFAFILSNSTRIDCLSMLAIKTIVVDYQYQHYNIGFSGLLWDFLVNLNGWVHQKIQKITILSASDPKTAFYIIFTA